MCIFFLRKFCHCRQFWNEEIFLFSLSIACSTLLHAACNALHYLHWDEFSSKCSFSLWRCRVHDCTMHVLECASVCVWMSAVCQFLRLVSFEYVENVNNFNIRWIFIFAFMPFHFQLYGIITSIHDRIQQAKQTFFSSRFYWFLFRRCLKRNKKWHVYKSL